MAKQFGVDSLEGADVGNPFEKYADEARRGKMGHRSQGRSKESERGKRGYEEVQQEDRIWGA